MMVNLGAMAFTAILRVEGAEVHELEGIAKIMESYESANSYAAIVQQARRGIREYRAKNVDADQKKKTVSARE